MSSVSFFKYFFDVPVRNIITIGLVEADLQLLPKLIFHHLPEFLFCNDDVELVRLFVLDFERLSLLLVKCLPDVLRDFRCHK